MSVPSLIALRGHRDSRGGLGFIEGGKDVPFEIRRVYYLFDVPAQSSRGAHAHKSLEQLFVAVNGSFNLTVDDGAKTHRFTLSSPSEGVYLPPGFWRDLDGFSPGAVCMVLASHPYDESDYLRDRGAFLAYKRTS